MKNPIKLKRDRTRQDFLLTFFNPEPTHQVKEINNFILVKQINNNLPEPRWEVAIYRKDNYQKVLDFLHRPLI